jgi:uncharacterized repeat protein (TIGR01451 family)
MTSIFLWSRRKSLLLSLVLISTYITSSIPSKGQTNVITNTASGGANGIPTSSSNPTTLTATQAALELIKTADRAAAEPGDTIVYRLIITNNGAAAATNLRIQDQLPLGLTFINKSLTGTINNNTTTLTANTTSQSTITISLTSGTALQPSQTLSIVYAAEVTPDAIRGTGRNLAIAQAGNLTSNSASYVIKITAGILSDCGTIIGRVFIDKNFDGEQQANEPGIPNAVIYMDDGNRIVTDANGLYSLASVESGYRSATLDLSSLPGYALAPNKHIIEKNSPSRLVKLAPGSMVRINFGVTPAFGESKR